MKTLNVQGQAQKVSTNYANFQISLEFRQSGLVDVNVNSLATKVKKLHCWITPARYYTPIDIDFIGNISDKQLLGLLKNIAKMYLKKVENKPISFFIENAYLGIYFKGAIYQYLSGYKIFIKKYLDTPDNKLLEYEKLESEFYL